MIYVCARTLILCARPLILCARTLILKLNRISRIQIDIWGGVAAITRFPRIMGLFGQIAL